MKKLFLTLMAVGALASSAAAAGKEAVDSYRYSTSEARLLDFNPSVAPVPLTVDIKVIGQRIHRKITLSPEELSKRVIENNYNKTLENLRSYAVFITSGVYDCDLLVGARFNFEITSDHGAVIEVFGYPANFVNWGGKGESLPVAKEVNPDYGKE
ncbi:MAG: hypothetical protein K2H33_06205 [Muribaculaceae bacterium]|nr:hypothetical protein [Muribaculaceae bacterium]MDE6315553.1 hypothetical protein [Muribaculaceae bacterium]